MANYLVGAVAGALSTPVAAVRALADLPHAMQQQMRQTNTLIEESQEQLRLMREQAEIMLAQLREMQITAEALRVGADPLVAAATATLGQLASTHAEVRRMNEQLARLIRLGEPIERAQRRGERFGSIFRRAQREAGPDGEGGAPAPSGT